MEKMDGNGLAISQENYRRLRTLFPEAIKEGKVDLDALQGLLGDFAIQGEESFGLNWIGKREAIRRGITASTCSLLPRPSSSISFDSTNNIYVEGDNLEVLKILSKTYRGKVQVIFIDPPYNTGEDRVYSDDMSQDKGDYIELSNQSLKSNPSTSGRYHTDWLNSLYPRLRLAKEMLAPTGAIFIAIDDHELHHLITICNEIFDEDNYVGCFIWEKKKKPSFLNKNIGKLNDYIVCYVKNEETSVPFSVETTTEGKKYPVNNAGNPRAILTFPAKSVLFNMPNQTVQPQDMSGGNIYTKLLDPVIIENGINVNEFRLEGEWRYSQEKLDQIISAGEQITISQVPFRPNHVKAGGEIKKMSNFLTRSHYAMETNEDASQQLVSYFGKDVFSNPKPVKLVYTLIKSVTHGFDDAIVMDFYSGSGTTAEAVMQLNAETGKHLSFILVQLPEDLHESLKNAKPDERQLVQNAIDYCEEHNLPVMLTSIGEERIKLAAARIKADLESERSRAGLLIDRIVNPDDLDFGFKVFRLDSSNIIAWDGTKQYSESEIVLFNKVIKDDRSNLDVAYEIMLKYGVFDKQLTEKDVNGKKMFSVDNDSMIICLADEITTDDVMAIIKLKPSVVVFKESGFKDDNEKMNADYTLKRYLGEGEIKVLCI